MPKRGSGQILGPYDEEEDFIKRETASRLLLIEAEWTSINRSGCHEYLII